MITERIKSMAIKKGLHYGTFVMTITFLGKTWVQNERQAENPSE